MFRGLLFCFILAGPQTAVPPPPAPTPATAAVPTQIRTGATVFIEPMDGFENNLAAAILKKGVPLTVVDDKAKAEYVISGTSKTDKAGWAKTIFISPLPHSEASIKMTDVQSGALLFAYSVDKSNARKGDQSTAEACAKHLKQAIDKK